MNVKLVIFDLDGTLLDTESLIVETASSIVARHGKKLTAQAQAASLGKTPLEAWQATIDTLDIKGVSAEQLVAESEPLLIERWHETKLMPGAGRLVEHFQTHGVPMAIGTSTMRRNYVRKMSGRHAASLAQYFQAAVCGDEVRHGKPAPDCFLQVAQQMAVPPSDCLVIEDSPAGAQAAEAAGMRVVVVPSLSDLKAYPEAAAGRDAGCVALLKSLLDFKPESYGLPRFEDTVGGVVPLHPMWHLKGPVVRGFGRGSKELGIPTANLETIALQGALAEAVTGIYAGFASIGSSPTVYKMCMSIGWNPFYQNERKTIEPWILHKFDRDFYDEELRLVVCGYIRPEQNFQGLDALIDRIHEDGRVSEQVLGMEPFKEIQNDSFLRPS